MAADSNYEGSLIIEYAVGMLMIVVIAIILIISRGERCSNERS
jgi:hypothetical protein